MNVKHKNQLSPEGQAMLDSLRRSVAAALEKKRRLGQYAVVWDGDKPVRRDFREPTPKD